MFPRMRILLMLYFSLILLAMLVVVVLQCLAIFLKTHAIANQLKNLFATEEMIKKECVMCFNYACKMILCSQEFLLAMHLVWLVAC